MKILPLLLEDNNRTIIFGLLFADIIRVLIIVDIWYSTAALGALKISGASETGSALETVAAELAIPFISPAVQIIGDNLKINSVIGGSTTSRKCKFATNRHNNKFKVATTPDTTTLEYYQSIYTHCKQRFNIPDGIEVVKKSVYQYIKNRINNYLFGNYNISEVKSNFYNNLVHYLQLETEDLNSETLATYFQELNFNIIEYCEEKYPVQPKYSFNFESETETSNKGKQKVKQYSRTTPNTSILPKTTAKHLQTPEQGTSIKLPLSITLFLISLVQPQIPSLPLNHFSRPEDFQSPRNLTQQQEPILTSANIIDYLQKNESNYSESLKSEETESEPKEITENKEEMATAYIAKIPEFTGKNNDTSPQEWLDKVQKAGDANGWIVFENLEELFENWQAFKDAFLQQFTDNNTSITLRNCFYNIKQETSETFIVGLKDKLIKKVRPHASADLATAIRHVKSYKMAIEEANHTKLTNLQKRLKATSQINNNSSNNHKDINPHNNTTKTILDHHPTTNLKIVIITNKTGVINITLHHNNLITNLHYQPIIYQDHKIKTQPLPIQPYQTPLTQQYQVPARKLIQHNQFTPQNQLQSNNNNPNNQLVLQNSGQQRPNHYHTQPSYLTIPEESDFQQTALSKSKVAIPRSNPSNHTIPPAQIAQNANLSDIFLFEFEANKSLFLLSNIAVNKQKAITAMYTKATVEEKPICLILDSGLAGSIITYQLMQQLKQNIDRPAQTVIVTANDMKKTSVEEINDFPFTIDRITIPVKVLVINALQYQALVGNNWLFKTNANLNWKTQELKILYQEQYTIVPATCEEKEMPLTETYMALGSPSNWAEETEQEIFKESREWKKRSGKWDKTLCLTCGDILPEEYNWINVAMREGVCDQTCQYVLSISEKVRKGTPFNAAYNSAFNKLYHYPHDTEMIFDLAMTLINRATQEDVCQMKEAEYIEYTMELAGFDYKDEVETYHQIASHTYPTKEAQIQ
ncbi:hypothetical protein G9A89_017642 [Geosiphon pyriformis]|nr:hypothetical protein G9A89_017642 [Geosiphon pyriformis]